MEPGYGQGVRRLRAREREQPGEAPLRLAEHARENGGNLLVDTTGTTAGAGTCAAVGAARRGELSSPHPACDTSLSPTRLLLQTHARQIIATRINLTPLSQVNVDFHIIMPGEGIGAKQEYIVPMTAVQMMLPSIRYKSHNRMPKPHLLLMGKVRQPSISWAEHVEQIMWPVFQQWHGSEVLSDISSPSATGYAQEAPPPPDLWRPSIPVEDPERGAEDAGHAAAAAAVESEEGIELRGREGADGRV